MVLGAIAKDADFLRPPKTCLNFSTVGLSACLIVVPLELSSDDFFAFRQKSHPPRGGGSRSSQAKEQAGISMRAGSSDSIIPALNDQELTNQYTCIC